MNRRGTGRERRGAQGEGEGGQEVGARRERGAQEERGEGPQEERGGGAGGEEGARGALEKAPGRQLASEGDGWAGRRGDG